MSTRAASSPRRPMRMAVVYNADFREAEAEANPDEPPSLEANSQIEKTAEDIAGVLREGGYEATILRVVSTPEELLPALSDGRVDAVFNLVESLGNDASREAEFPAFLERLGIPYTGNSPAPLRLAHAKERTRARLKAKGLPVAPGLAVRTFNDLDRFLASSPAFPLFVKPAHGDASIGIDQGSIVRDRDALVRRVEHLLAHRFCPVMVEKYLTGREINVAFFPNPVTGRETLREIDFGSYPTGFEPIVTYDCKWIEDSPEFAAFSKPLDPAISRTDQAEILRVARAAFLAIAGDSYGRVDLRLDETGRPVVMDVNPNPDIDRAAGLATGAREIGMNYPELVWAIAAEASLKENHAPAPHNRTRPRTAGVSA